MVPTPSRLASASITILGASGSGRYRLIPASGSSRLDAPVALPRWSGWLTAHHEKNPPCNHRRREENEKAVQYGLHEMLLSPEVEPANRLLTDAGIDRIVWMIHFQCIAKWNPISTSKTSPNIE